MWESCRGGENGFGWGFEEREQIFGATGVRLDLFENVLKDGVAHGFGRRTRDVRTVVKRYPIRGTACHVLLSQAFPCI